MLGDASTNPARTCVQATIFYATMQLHSHALASLYHWYRCANGVASSLVARENGSTSIMRFLDPLGVESIHCELIFVVGTDHEIKFPDLRYSHEHRTHPQ